MTQTKTKPFHTQLPRKLVNRLRKVQKFIVENPKQFDMGTWAEPSGNACGTVGCIAGHMAMLDTPRIVVKEAVKRCTAQRHSGTLLRIINKWRSANIPLKFRRNFDSLFLPSSDGRDSFRTRRSNITAKGAARRIEHFLQTGE